MTTGSYWSNKRNTSGRLAAPSGVDTGTGSAPLRGSSYWSQKRSGATGSDEEQDQGALKSLGRLASFATSGQDFIKTTTGVDIEPLPWYLEKPIDILANPVGIASLLAAPFTGGTSLAALGARGVATKVAGTAITGLAGGLVGGEVGKLAAEYTPGPDWLKAGAGLAAGIAAGGVTGAKVAGRLPKAFQVGAKLGPNATAKEIRLAREAGFWDPTRLDRVAAQKSSAIHPLDLIDTDPNLNKVQQISNAVKRGVGKGVVAHEAVTPILDDAQRSAKVLDNLANDARAGMSTLRETLKDSLDYRPEATYLKVRSVADDTEIWVPVAEAVTDPSLYTIEPGTRQLLKSLSDELLRYHQQFRAVGGRVGIRADIKPGGFYLPRGAVDEFAGHPYRTTKYLAKNPDAAKSADYLTQTEGIANGVKYPTFDEAVEDYVRGMGSATIGQGVSQKLTKIRDADGNFVFSTADEMVDPLVSGAYKSAESKLYGLQEKLYGATQRKQELLAQQRALTFAQENTPSVTVEVGTAAQKLQTAIDDIDIKIQNLEGEMALHDPVFASARDTYTQRLEQIKSDPLLGTLEPNNLTPLMAARDEKLYGPRGATDAFNAMLNPNGPLQAARKLTGDVNGMMRLFHTVFDISDFGRLAGTAGLMDPKGFWKGIRTGFKTLMSPNSVYKNMQKGDLELASMGIPYNHRDFIKYGMAVGIPDIDLGLLNKLPYGTGNITRKLSNITQSGISTMRYEAVKTQLMNMKAAGQMIDEDTLQSVIKGINLTTGSSIHRGIKGADLFIQFPNWIQSQFEFLIHGAAGVPSLVGLGTASFENKYAANALVRMVGLGVMSTYIVNGLGGKDTVWKNGVPQMRIGDTNINAFGPYGALVSGMTAAAQGNLEPLLRSRASPLFQIGWDLGTGRTYMGDVASFDDPEYWAKALAPYSFTGGRDEGAVNYLLQGAGVRAHQVNSFQLLREQALETMGTDWADLSGKQKEQLRIANPELVAALDKETKRRAETGDPYAKNALETQKINDELIAQQETLNQLVQTGEISPVQFRESLRQLALVSSTRKQQIRADLGVDTGSKEPAATQKALNDYFDLFTKADSGILIGGVKTGTIDWDVFERLEAELFSNLTPQQQKVIQDRYVVRSPALNWYYENKSVIENSGYFEVVDAIIDRMKPSLKAIDPSINSYTDLKQAYQKAQQEGNTGMFLRLTALINRINSQQELQHRRMTLQNPLLYKALVQNGYTKQAKSRPLAANIQ